MPSFLIVANHHSITPGNDTAQAIEEAFRAVQTDANVDASTARIRGFGHWVGPQARITRNAQIGARDTTAAWLFEFPDIPQGPGISDQDYASFQNGRFYLLTEQLWANLNRMDSGWSTPRLVPYDPSVNGSRQWWSSGQASNTATRDGYDLNQQFGSTYAENPLGPTVNAGPPSLGPTVSSRELLYGLAFIVGAGGLLYLAGPLLRDAINRGK